ncbi:unnamed protein product, partial [Laminaria digitata]
VADNSSSVSSNSAADTADILNDLWHNFESNNSEARKALSTNGGGSEGEKADNSDDETGWGFVPHPGPETAAAATAAAAAAVIPVVTPSNAEPQLPPSRDVSEAGGPTTPDHVNAGEPDPLEISVAPLPPPPPPPPSADAGEPVVVPPATSEECAPSAPSWAN